MRAILYLLLCTAASLAQSETGELRLRVTDPAGLPVPSSVELVSQANQVRQTLDTDAEGALAIKRLPFGKYRLRVQRSGFAPLVEIVEVRSALPKELRVTLAVDP